MEKSLNILTLKGTEKLLYESLLQKASSLPAGMPLPAMQKLKEEFNVGFDKLRRVLACLHTEGWIVIRKNHGVFVADRQTEAELTNPVILENEYHHIPWLKTDVPELSLLIPGCPGETKMWNELVETHNHDNSHAKVIIKVQTERKSPNSSDLVYFTDRLERIISYPESGSLLDLTPFIEQEPPELPIYDCAWDRDSQTGAILGVPLYLVTPFLAYQRKHFKNTELSTAESFDWEDILDWGKAVKKNFGIQKVLLYSGYMPFFFRWGINLFSPDGNQVKIDPEELNPLLLLLRKLIVKEQIAPYWSEAKDQYNFKQYNSYSMIEASSYLNIEEKVFGLAPMPLKNGSIESIYYPPLSIKANTLYPNECWEFIRFVISEAGQRIVAKYRLDLPVAKGIVPEHVSLEKLELMRRIVESGQSLPEEYVAPFLTRSIIQTEIEGWLRKETDVSKLCKKIEKRCALMLS